MTIRQVLAHGALVALISPALLAAGGVGIPLDDQAASSAAASDKLVVPFSDPSRPGVLRVGLTTGAIKVTAHQGKDVVIVTNTTESERGDRVDRQGLRRITNNSGGLTVEEERNEMRIS